MTIKPYRYVLSQHQPDLPEVANPNILKYSVGKFLDYLEKNPESAKGNYTKSEIETLKAGIDKIKNLYDFQKQTVGNSRFVKKMARNLEKSLDSYQSQVLNLFQEIEGVDLTTILSNAAERTQFNSRDIPPCSSSTLGAHLDGKVMASEPLLGLDSWVHPIFWFMARNGMGRIEKCHFVSVDHGFIINYTIEVSFVQAGSNRKTILGAKVRQVLGSRPENRTAYVREDGTRVEARVDTHRHPEDTLALWKNGHGASFLGDSQSVVSVESLRDGILQDGIRLVDAKLRGAIVSSSPYWDFRRLVFVESPGGEFADQSNGFSRGARQSFEDFQVSYWLFRGMLLSAQANGADTTACQLRLSAISPEKIQNYWTQQSVENAWENRYQLPIQWKNSDKKSFRSGQMWRQVARECTFPEFDLELIRLRTKMELMLMSARKN